MGRRAQGRRGRCSASAPNGGITAHGSVHAFGRGRCREEIRGRRGVRRPSKEHGSVAGTACRHKDCVRRGGSCWRPGCCRSGRLRCSNRFCSSPAPNVAVDSAGDGVPVVPKVGQQAMPLRRVELHPHKRPDCLVSGVWAVAGLRRAKTTRKGQIPEASLTHTPSPSPPAPPPPLDPVVPHDRQHREREEGRCENKPYRHKTAEGHPGPGFARRLWRQTAARTRCEQRKCARPWTRQTPHHSRTERIINRPQEHNSTQAQWGAPPAGTRTWEGHSRRRGRALKRRPS
jgi:hypothetical protein